MRKLELILSRPLGAEWLSRVLMPSHADYDFEQEIYKKWGTHQGYFQNWRYVEETWNQIEKEIYEKLNQMDLDIKYDLESSYTVVHVRRGDYLGLKNIYGILSLKHYEEALKSLDQDVKENLYVISDDAEVGREFSEQLGAIRAFAPHDLGEWEALKFMSKARCVVAANSTFSWWGSFLCYKNGGIAVLPSEYFISKRDTANMALQFPGSRVSNSIYE